MSRYKRGAAFERRIQHWLEGKGYLVIRSAGSHGIFDLIAISDYEVFGIQLKSANENKYGNGLKKFREYKNDFVIKILIVNGKERDEIYRFINNDYFLVDIL